MIERLKSETWIGWLGAACVFCATAVAITITYAFGQFETKDHAKETTERHEKTVDEIKGLLRDMSNKLDKLPRGPAGD